MPRVRVGITAPVPAVVPAIREPEQLALFGGVAVDVAGLRVRRAAAAAARRSSATVRGYASDWRDFSGWCGRAGRGSLPASADTVGLYAVQLAQLGRALATIRRRMAAVRDRHLADGYASPVTAEVCEVLAGLARQLGTAPVRAKAAVTPAELRAMLAAVDGCGRRGPYSWRLSGGELRAVRDRALLLLGFGGGLRRSELAGLQLADVELLPAGVLVRLRRSKTDQAGAGRELGVHRGRRRSTCPARALGAWLAVRGSWAGPLFCRIGQGGGVERAGLSGAAVAAVVQGAAARAGMDASRYGGHSLRAGLATAAAAAGASELAIMARTGHRSAEMVGRYVRHGSLFAVDPLAGVL